MVSQEKDRRIGMAINIPAQQHIQRYGRDDQSLRDDISSFLHLISTGSSIVVVEASSSLLHTLTLGNASLGE